jgi:hypothetical protein
LDKDRIEGNLLISIYKDGKILYAIDYTHVFEMKPSGIVPALKEE